MPRLIVALLTVLSMSALCCRISHASVAHASIVPSVNSLPDAESSPTDFARGPAKIFTLPTAGWQLGVQLYQREPGTNSFYASVPPLLVVDPEAEHADPAFAARLRYLEDDLGQTVRFAVRLHLWSPDILSWVERELALHGAKVDPLPITDVILVLEDLGQPIAYGRINGTVSGQPEVNVHFEVNHQTWAQLAFSWARGELSTQAYLRYDKEVATRRATSTVRVDAQKINEARAALLKRAVELRSEGQLVLLSDLARVSGSLRLGASHHIRASDESLLPLIVEQELMGLLTLGLVEVDATEVRSLLPTFDPAEYLEPLLREELSSQGLDDAAAATLLRSSERSTTGGVGVSIPFLGIEHSETKTTGVVRGLERRAGVRFERNASSQSWELTHVRFARLLQEETVSEVTQEKSVVIDGSRSAGWIEQASVPASLTKARVIAALTAWHSAAAADRLDGYHRHRRLMHDDRVRTLENQTEMSRARLQELRAQHERALARIDRAHGDLRFCQAEHERVQGNDWRAAIRPQMKKALPNFRKMREIGESAIAAYQNDVSVAALRVSDARRCLEQRDAEAAELMRAVAEAELAVALAETRLAEAARAAEALEASPSVEKQ